MEFAAAEWNPKLVKNGNPLPVNYDMLHPDWFAIFWKKFQQKIPVGCESGRGNSESSSERPHFPLFSLAIDPFQDRIVRFKELNQLRCRAPESVGCEGNLELEENDPVQRFGQNAGEIDVIRADGDFSMLAA